MGSTATDEGPDATALLKPGEELRLVPGLVTQAVLAPMMSYFLFPYLIFSSAERAADRGNVWDASLGVAFYVAVYSFVITLVGVLPTAVWIMRRRPVSLWTALRTGVRFGVAPIIVGTLLTNGGYGAEAFLRNMALAASIGALGASVFWLMPVRSLPLRFTRSA